MYRDGGHEQVSLVLKIEGGSLSQGVHVAARCLWHFQSRYQPGHCGYLQNGAVNGSSPRVLCLFLSHHLIIIIIIIILSRKQLGDWVG